MAEIISFKQRVASTVSYFAQIYKDVFVDNEYLVCSEAFQLNPYYIISSRTDNYMHLTGVSFYDPQVFFQKCIDGTLNESEISFVKKRQTEASVKGSVRRKISVLPNLMKIFEVSLEAEEAFSKNRVYCSFGTSDGVCTVGFTLTSNNSYIVKPMTLLSGSELDTLKSKPIELILKRKSGTEKFDEIVFGGFDTLNKYKNSFFELLSDSLVCDSSR